jgi:hypothetical protein
VTTSFATSGSSLASRDGSWSHLTLEPDELSLDALIAMFHGEVSGIRIPEFIDPRTCDTVVERFSQTETDRPYDGAANIRKAFEIILHWEARYLAGNFPGWDFYHAHTPQWHAARRALFEGITPDLLDAVTFLLSDVWPAAVGLARHPATGNDMYAEPLGEGSQGCTLIGPDSTSLVFKWRTRPA